MDSPSQASRRIGRPIDDAVLVAGEQLPSRDAVLDFVRSLPNGLAGSTLALFLGSDFKLLALDLLGEVDFISRVAVMPRQLHQS